MFKTVPLPLKICSKLLQVGFMALEAGKQKNDKFSKNLKKLQKLVSLFVIMLALQKHIAVEIAIISNENLQETLIIFDKRPL